MFKLDMPRTHRIEAGFLRAKQEGMEQAKMQDNARWELQSIQNARMQNKSTQFDPARRADASRRKKGKILRGAAIHRTGWRRRAGGRMQGGGTQMTKDTLTQTFGQN